MVEINKSVVLNPAHIAVAIAIALNAVLLGLVIYSGTHGIWNVRAAKGAANKSELIKCLPPLPKAGVRAGETGNVPAPTANTSASTGSTLSSLTWGRYEVTHTYVMTVDYSHHNILIFKQSNSTIQNASIVRFYYQPALFLDESRINVTFNYFTQQYEIRLYVLMWNQAFEEQIRRQIRQQYTATDFLLNIIPVESIRIKPVGLNRKYRFIDRWIPYASQPQYVIFRLICPTQPDCDEIAGNIREAPSAFIWNLRVQYSLEGQHSVGKSITVKAEHVQQTSMYAAINQKLPQKNPVYLTSDDANKLSTEIANNIQGVEIEDEDYIAEQNAPTLMALINKALQFVSNNTKDFDNNTWNSVFWSDDNSRPDRVTQETNDVYSQLDEKSKSRFKNEVESSTSKGFSFELGLTFKTKGNADASGGVGASYDTSKVQMSQKEVDQLNHLLQEAKKKSTWKGEKFVPKPMDVKRMNTGNIKVGTELSTTNLRVSVATSMLTDAIKLVDVRPGDMSSIFSKKQSSNEVFLVKAKTDYTRFTKAEAASICQVLNAVLASVEQLESAFVAGGDWCFTGHTNATNVAAYPGGVCYAYQTDGSGNTVLPLKTQTVTCGSLEKYHRKTFVYKTVGSSGDVGVDSMRFGANCWGLRPSKGEKLKYKNDVIVVLPFNSTHYSQYYA
ncbi:uncharacterized protein LOC129597554 [Paramacrobiotus metropolitanus]|uniref:uncharacterized protein LOC129597554 n=1 Tax=Paramacrobiotus metropolitanus TaxID=2943436 RepID=UPI0024462E01|nr:uncharacterized protein LOC129597554 [Paramacrobiotus metropolitanus]